MAQVNGILLLDKPKGITSNAALQKVRYKLGADKAGHSGTLDPMATGLLPIGVGQGTKSCLICSMGINAIWQK
jgi:tRNA pseudouridine55 synthase